MCQCRFVVTRASASLRLVPTAPFRVWMPGLLKHVRSPYTQAALTVLLVVGCAQPRSSATTYATWADPVASLPHDADHTAAVCARPGDDPVRSVFCAGTPPDITSLVDLETALQIDSASLGGVRGIAASAHSTSLSIRSVSAINPRLLALRIEIDPVELMTLAFTRGEQFSEVAVRDRGDHELRFYVVGFRQACNRARGGCRPGELLTPAIEWDWTEVTLYDETDVTDTVLDCATCHQPQGPGTPKLLRMQEVDDPWTHWLFRNSDGGAALLADYSAARGDEGLGGMTADQVQDAHPENLDELITYNSPPQPYPFDTAAIEAEVRASAAERGGNQPVDNSIPGQSATWQAAYARSLAGEVIPVPYHDVKVTDVSKLARMTRAYQDYRRGDLARDELPDIRDVFPDDPKLLAEMGMMTEPGLSGEGVLLQACSPCHNARLDQSLSRARFRADLEGMSRQEKDAAIGRLGLPESDPHVMPPALLRTLTDEARNRAIETLRR